MRDHPGSARGEAFRTVLATLGGAQRFSRAAAASRAMRLHVGETLRRGCAALVGRVRQSALARHRCAIGRGQERARRLLPASRTFVGQIAFRHRPHPRERPAGGTEIVVDWHGLFLGLPLDRSRSCRRKARGAARHRPPPVAGRRHYLSGDIGMGTPPLTCLMGPAALGITSKSKISVGSQRVAQALGISTTPEI